MTVECFALLRTGTVAQLVLPLLELRSGTFLPCIVPLAFFTTASSVMSLPPQNREKNSFASSMAVSDLQALHRADCYWCWLHQAVAQRKAVGLKSTTGAKTEWLPTTMVYCPILFLTIHKRLCGSVPRVRFVLQSTCLGPCVGGAHAKWYARVQLIE